MELESSQKEEKQVAETSSYKNIQHPQSPGRCELKLLTFLSYPSQKVYDKRKQKAKL